MKLKKCLEIGEYCNLVTIKDAITNIEYYFEYIFSGDNSNEILELAEDWANYDFPENMLIVDALKFLGDVNE